ncbi:MAG: lipid-A-disaccharide synthase [Verrucomicrobiota bacterium]|nr:lipid-A-disaccharide synthase [Verrucomicrobiota bacterium]
MKSKSFMLIAGEASGDLLAAELVKALRDQNLQNENSKMEFFGAGGPKMAGSGVDLAFDLTTHSVIGLLEVLKSYSQFKKLFDQLLQLAIERKPDVIVCIDFSGFNRRFANAVRKFCGSREGRERNWNPKIVQYVSPQVWASRPGRAEKMARDIDLLLCIFPFEKDWYAKRVPNLRVEFVGHPIIDRHTVGTSSTSSQKSLAAQEKITDAVERVPTILLLPGSRAGELQRHLPVMMDAARKIKAKHNVRFWMVLPTIELDLLSTNYIYVNPMRELGEPIYNLKNHPHIRRFVGNLNHILPEADLAIASTGTVTMECAYFGVPTIAIYKTSWSTYQIGKRIIQVKFLAMPNLLANEMIFPEFIQADATPENISREALDLLNNSPRRELIKNKLQKIISSLGEAGASERAAKAILNLEESR